MRLTVLRSTALRAAVKTHTSPTPIQMLAQNRHLFTSEEMYKTAENLIVDKKLDLLSLAMLDCEELRHMGISSLATRSRILAVSELAHTEVFVVSPTASATNALLSGPVLAILLAVVGISVAALIVVPILQVQAAVNDTTTAIAATAAAVTNTTTTTKK